MRPGELAADHDGVLAQAGAGTPSPFPLVDSQAASEALELDRVLELVAEHTVGPLGAARERAGPGPPFSCRSP